MLHRHRQRHQMKPMMTKCHFSVAQTAILRRMVAEGASAREIGAAIGKSRNAVVGKAYRLGIDWRAAKRGPPPAQCPPASRRVAHHVPPHERGEPLKPPQAELSDGKRKARRARKPSVPPVVSPAVSIWAAGPFHCRFPITEVSPIDDFRFCGAPAPFRAYCPKHEAMMRSRQRRQK
jgi:hypothetical protein